MKDEIFKRINEGLEVDRKELAAVMAGDDLNESDQESLMEYALNNNIDTKRLLSDILQEAIWLEIKKETGITRDQYDQLIVEKLKGFQENQEEKDNENI